MSFCGEIICFANGLHPPKLWDIGSNFVPITDLLTLAKVDILRAIMIFYFKTPGGYQQLRLNQYKSR